MFTRCQGDGRQARCYCTGSKSKVGQRESRESRQAGGVTRAQSNKLEEMMLTTGMAASVFLFTSWFQSDLSISCQDLTRLDSEVRLKRLNREARKELTGFGVDGPTLQLTFMVFKTGTRTGSGRIFQSEPIQDREKTYRAWPKLDRHSAFLGFWTWPKPNAVNISCTGFVLPSPWHADMAFWLCSLLTDIVKKWGRTWPIAKYIVKFLFTESGAAIRSRHARVWYPHSCQENAS